jgi:4-hydroxy 2-oxovalerate aldolase
MFRPEIKVVDCTIRDGGLVNDSHFDLETVRAAYQAACDAGIDYVELGYRNSKEMFDPEEFGPWRFCSEDDLKRATEGIDPQQTKLTVMMDAHKSTPDDLLPADESLVDMVRCSTYVKDVDKAIHLTTVAKELGYECAINIMAISQEGGPFLDEALQQIEEESPAQAVYIVDSFGALYSETVHYLVERFSMFIKTKEVGVHMHNNQQLAFANTIEGIIKGANYLDATFYGLGRGAGNCPLELLLGFLKNPRYNLVPVLKVLGEKIVPLLDEIDWGYRVPYAITGQLDRHPSAAINWLKGETPNDFVEFYDQITED